MSDAMWSFAKTHPALIAAFGMCQILSVDRVPRFHLISFVLYLFGHGFQRLKTVTRCFILLRFHFRSFGFIVLYTIGIILLFLTFGLSVWWLLEFLRGEGAFFPLVFYSAARLPGSLVQVLNQTLIPSTATGRKWFVAMQRHELAKKEPV